MCSRLNCRFVHEGAPDAMAGGMPQPGMMPMNPGMGGPMGPMGGMPMNPPMGGGGPGVCYDWQKGICSRVNCRFAHGDAGGMPPQGGFAPQQGGFGGGGGRGICYDWQKGVCNRAACRFAHGEEQPGQGGGFGGGPGGGGGLKPGDWLCPGCNFHNFASRVQCFKCYAPVPMDAPIGFNPTNGPGGFMPGYGQQPGFGYGGAPPPNVRPGDWSCPQCNMNNFASRTECFKCNTPKDPNAPTVPGDAFPQQAHGGGNFGNDQVRDGDWSCPACNINNFASRVACFKCSAPKPV
ncbi:hypothetical protein TeGR_g11896 [Tetraparma gracilis]|uniref:Uncharacterized protein n=1 Tax=Tetraparma gracilis TaxID=2962635 RepID=A0ABQ6MJU3_9STRA|nr:hypothetical protein TeGR_g11896 [Tetraparma gracilis]